MSEPTSYPLKKILFDARRTRDLEIISSAPLWLVDSLFDFAMSYGCRIDTESPCRLSEINVTKMCVPCAAKARGRSGGDKIRGQLAKHVESLVEAVNYFLDKSGDYQESSPDLASDIESMLRKNLESDTE